VRKIPSPIARPGSFLTKHKSAARSAGVFEAGDEIHHLLLQRLAPSEEFSDLVAFEFDALNCPRIDWHSNSSWSA